MLLAAVVLMLWPSDPVDPTLAAGTGPSQGETVGWISKVEANTIHVSSGPFGGGVIPLLVTRQTRITVGSKEGWFDDIRPGGQVKVSYEISHGQRRARSVQLLVDEVPKRPVRPEPRVTNTASGTPTERSSDRTGAASAALPGRTASETKASPQPIPASAGPPTAAPPRKPVLPAALDTQPAPRPEPSRAQMVETPTPPRASTATSTRSGAATETGTRPLETTRPASSAQPAPAGRAPEATRPAEGGDSTDGSAAVDWLMKGHK